MAIPLAPVGPAQLICLGCGSLMRLSIEQFKNGAVSRIVHYCDKCKYGHEISQQHASGQLVAYKPRKEGVMLDESAEFNPTKAPA